MLTPDQQRTALRAIGCAGEFRSGAWKDCGPLAQIALLTGNTEADLERWDSIGNGDGPLTIRRIQESGNGFAGWPLDVLEALDRAWKVGASRDALERIVRNEGGQTNGDGKVAEPGNIQVPKWMLMFAVPLAAAVIGAVAADIRTQDKTDRALAEIVELREVVQRHMADDDQRHAMSTEQRFKMSQQIQWLCVQRARDNSREGAENAGQCP